MWSAASGAFELVLRACLRNETNGMVGTHVALYFTDANQSMQIKNELFNRNDYSGQDKSSFFVDILNAENDTISYLQDPKSWYNRWKHGRRIELYEVLDVDDAQIEVVVVGGGDVADAAVGEGIGSIAPIENSTARDGANVSGLKSEASTSQAVASRARSHSAAACATRASRARHCRRVLFV